ncbi:MAG: hypothetical protein QOE70_2829 [Chthoniobacter sp.]|jgi:hypothetical protein|nr:hypothetical protein [Chthoniobacter sp.]
MAHQRRTLVFLAAVGFVAAVDLVHTLLNRIFNPFTGPWDTAMHYVLAVTPIAYVAVCVWGCFRIARHLEASELPAETRLPSVVLLLLLGGEIAWSSRAPVRSGSSSYHPLFPDFLGGLMLAAATLMAGRGHLISRVCRVFVVLTAFAWLAGSLTVDLLWWTERTNRGVGPVWQVPLLGSAIAGFSYLFMLAGVPAETCMNFPKILFNGGSIVQLAWWLALAVFLAWGLRRLASGSTWLSSLALAASAIFLAHQAIEWGSFIAD